MTDWAALEDTYLLPTYAKLPLVLDRGEGSYVWDVSGKRYLDYYGGHAVALLGHAPPAVAKALARQAERLMFFSNVVYHPARATAARALVEVTGVPGGRVFFCNSGAEANENAARIARLVTGRPTIVATRGAFHGRTAGALAMTGIDGYKKNTAGIGSDVIHVPFGDLEAAAAVIGPDTAGMILEPVQSMAGVIMPAEGYLAGLERLCRDRGALLILDEIQTGLGRLGEVTAARRFGVTPHLMTFAKGIASGFPAGAVVAAGGLAANLQPGDLGSTFGGGPMACAAIEASLGLLVQGRCWENARAMEAALRDALRLPGVTGIRGSGLLLGVELDRPARPVQAALLDRGVLVGSAQDPVVLRLMPPITIGPTEVRELASALAGALDHTGAGEAP